MKTLKMLIIVTALGLLVNRAVIASESVISTTVSVSIGSSVMCVDDKSIDIEPPYIDDNNVVMVPVRAIAEAWGAEVIWSEKRPREVVVDYIQAGKTEALYYIIGSNYVTDSGIVIGKIELNESNTTMVPLESLAEFFGAQVKKNQNRVTMTRELFHTKNKSKFTNSIYNWSINIPKDRLRFIERTENQERYVFGDRDGIFIISEMLPDERRINIIDEYYEEWNSAKPNAYEHIIVEKGTRKDLGEYIFRKAYSVEGTVLEQVCLKGNIFYNICAIIYDNKKIDYIDYCEDLIKTFSLQTSNEEGVIDLTNVKTATNIFYD